MRLDVVLKPRDPTALSAFASAVSTPGSPVYRQFLSPDQFTSTFGPRTAAIDAVEAHLRSAGLSIAALSANHLVVGVTGTAEQAEAAFHVHLRTYADAKGATVFVPDRPPSMPARVAEAVQEVVGLDDLPVTIAPRSAPLAASPRTSSSCPASGGYWTPKQQETAYDIAPLLTGGDTAGSVRIALFETGPFAQPDITAYNQCFNRSAGSVVQPTSVAVDGSDTSCPSGGCDDETALDVEVLLGLIPHVGGIDVYVSSAAKGDRQLIDGYNAIAIGADQVVSTSVGVCENSSLSDAEQPIFEEMASQGQSVFAATGDVGSEGTCYTNGQPLQTVQQWDPASQPTVTAVGGTDLTSLGTPPTSVGSPPVKPPTETAWNDRTYLGCPCPLPGGATGGGAGGGGVSLVWPLPSYQQVLQVPGVPGPYGAGVPCGSTVDCREVPDVSGSADAFHGYPYFWDGSWQVGTATNGRPFGIGGTSAATPLWAAIAALTQDSPACGGTRLGLLNPTLYELAARVDSSTYLNDISATGKRANNDWTGQLGGLYPVAPGYDMATGLGTPVAANLAAFICAQPWPYEGNVTNGQKSSVGGQLGSAYAAGAVGAPTGDDENGAVFTFQSSGDTGPATELTAADGAHGDQFGSALAGFSWGQLQVGAPGHAGRGAVYVFNASASPPYTYTLSQELVPATGGHPRFGSALAWNAGSILVVGAPSTTSTGGAVYVYQGSGTSVETWTLLKKLSAPGGTADGGLFGSAVAVDNFSIIVGDPGVAGNTGAVYVYNDTGTKVALTATLTPSDAVAGGGYGSSLAVADPTLVVGAPGTSEGPAAAYVFAMSTSAPPQFDQELTPSSMALDNPSPGDVAVAAFQSPEGCGATMVAIGLPTLDANSSGAAYVYASSGATSWTPTATLLDPVQGSDDMFGAAMTGESGQLLVGEPGYFNPFHKGSHADPSINGTVDVYGPQSVCP